MTGEKILNYRIENLTEENQLYRSFLATHTQFSKKVVIKTLKNPQNATEKAEFEEEIKKLSRIQHPNIITLYDHLETDHDFYLVFEHIEGRSLGEYIRKFSGPIPEKKAIQFFIKILDAFDLAHHKAIYGGAINPSNIIIAKDESIKVLDLAFSKLYNHKNFQQKDRETCLFANPEQFSELPPDSQSDIYTLGVLLFYMLTAQHPYEDLGFEDIRNKALKETLPDARKYYPVISTEIQTIISKATSKIPSERFKSCQDFKEALLNISTPQTPKLTQNVDLPPITSQPGQRFANAPLIVFLSLLGVLIFMIIIYSRPRPQYQSSILLDIKNQTEIRQRQDSIAEAQAKKAVEDSIRIFGSTITEEDNQIYFHKVERGETLEKIAKRFYLPLDTLVQLNDISPTEKLKARQGIKVLVKTIYKVKGEETLAQIGDKFKISPFILKEVNQLYPQPLEPGEIPKPLIYEGKNIIIPLMLKK